MSRPQVTITLGRSGQKVVKRSSASQGSSFGQQTLSRGKRSLGDTYRTHAEDPSLSLRKRSYLVLLLLCKDARVGQNDLRLKLIRRRRQREMLLKIEERKKEQHKRMTGSVQSAKESHRRLVTSSQPLSGASELLQMDAIRSSYASQTAGGVRPRSPNRLAKDSKEVSSSRNITAVQHIPSVRPAEASRTVRMLGNDLLDPSQLNGLTPMTMRSALAARNPLSGLPSANGRMLQSSFPV
ncbi:hypothetical protein RND71_011296 [Anisodus tanguticus]|uniref:Uncharacterized protein n=1 Tax=Anisodus tanguticus TaxID=243964 RepID=A0AAE1SDH8_9SOLA|nr:hypothetical protein RND71_011296 [Anisodus tanguticus]